VVRAADRRCRCRADGLHRDLSPPGQGCKGLGVVWEARIIRQLLYDAGAVSGKFVPVLFSDASPEQIPTPIKGDTRYVIDTEDGYEELYRRLTGQPRLLRPALGMIRALPTRRRQWPEGTMETASSSSAPASAAAPDDVASVRRGALVRKLWPFLQQDKNRQVLGWLGGGVVVFAGGLWAVVNFLSSSHPPPQGPDVHVEAPGGVGAGGDIRSSTITVHPQAPPAASPSSPDPGAER
jgi:hypothetical protein